MYCESMPIVFPATSVVHVGFWRARCSWSMITFSESTMARSRCTATESLCSSSPYRASATSPGSAGRGSTHSRPSPTCGGLTRCGPMAAELAASALSGLPTVGAGGGVVVSMTAARAEPAPRHGHDAFLFECAALERGRGEAFGERHPQVQRGPRRLGLEPLGAQHRQHGVPPLAEPRDVLAGQLFGLRQHGRARRL